jgi:hypothetical protein
MINEKQILNKVLEEGQSQASIGMTLDMESAQVLMQMLSKNLYSDPIGSTVRECASNALDSHRRAGVAEAIVVSLKVNTQNNYEFCVEDFGTGLDADDVENIISKYGKSTKRESNTEIGMMGLGFKSPLAYCSSFYFTCRKDGIERKYMMYEGEDVNTIDLLYETPTEERNGVKVIVPVKFADRFTFKRKINEQLAYFESVYFDVNVQNEIVTNEFNIHRSEHFQISEMNTDLSIHICLDNVYYPLDFAKLGIPIISLPIGLRFSLTDGLYPTPNREQLIYSSQAKATILKKLEIVSDYFVDKYNEHNIDCDSVKSIFEYYSSSNRNVTIGNTVIDVSKFPMTIGKKFKKPEYKKFPLTDFQLLYRHKDYMFYEYRLSLEFYRGMFRQVKGYHSGNLGYNDIINQKKIYEYDELFVGNKKSYIKTLLPVNSYDTIKFVKKSKTLTLRNKDRNTAYGGYIDILDLKRHPKSSWRARIIEFQAIVKELTSKIEFVDDIAIPQAWLDARKKKRVSMGSGTKRLKLQGEINCKQATDLQRYVSGKSSKLVPRVMKVENIESSKCLIVYGKQEHESLADQLYSVSCSQKVIYLILSDREHKVAQTLDFHNFISIEKFMEGKNKPFKRIITGYLIHVLQEKYNDTFSKKEVLKTISKPLYDELIRLTAYHNANYHRLGDYDVYEAMLVIAEEHKLFDETIYTEYKKVKDLLDNFPFIETTMEIFPYSHYNPIKDEHKNILSDLFKYYRIRIDYTNYKLVLNEDIIEPLTEETIEELTQNN